ncbi:MAG: hypothetical protein K2Z80_03235 [Xanthobacteraceae bacterium]|nr:hypothetical protein [Xanthobacteraceae bacterium]
MRYEIQQKGDSASFPPGDKFLSGAAAQADVVICLGGTPVEDVTKKAVVVELGAECLADHIDEARPESRNIVGFARYRNGADAPSNLIELVRHSASSEEAVTVAKAVFEAAGLTVVVCSDQPGRILDRLLRPKYNAALRFLDEGLATAADMDKTCKLGLGYPDGPIERVLRGGLAHHYDVTQALFETYGTPAYAPPRLALAAAKRSAR